MTQINGKDTLYSWTGRVNTVKMSKQPKPIYRFNATPINIPMVFFTEVGQIILKYVWSYERPQNSQSNHKEEQY